MDALSIAAASGMRSRMQTLDLLANNLANATTSGFKRDQEYYGLYHSEDSVDADGGGPSSTLPNIERAWTDFSPGEIQVTGNQLNIALPGAGFFTVNGPSGPLYTRSGNLQILNGQLASAEGYPISNNGGGTIQIDPTKPITIGADGTVQQNGQTAGQIQVVNFKTTDSLRKTSGASFQNTNPKNQATPVANPNVQQGKLEGSNVPVAEAAMKLVGVMRQFEMLQKAIGLSNDMDSKSISEVARVGG